MTLPENLLLSIRTLHVTLITKENEKPSYLTKAKLYLGNHVYLGGVSTATFFSFFKNHFNKNVEAEICPKI